MLFDKDNKGRTPQGESMLWFNCFCFNKSWSDTVVGNHSAVTGCTVLLTVCVQIFYLFLCCSELKHLSFYSVIPCTWLVKKKALSVSCLRMSKQRSKCWQAGMKNSKCNTARWQESHRCASKQIRVWLFTPPASEMPRNRLGLYHRACASLSHLERD